MDNIQFNGKVAIVTGASSGIGAETAVALAKFGAILTLVGRDETRLVHTVTRCISESKTNMIPLWLKLDLTHSGNCEAVVKTTIEHFGRIDVLVNCAGILRTSSLSDTSMDTFDEIMNINFRVPYHLSQLALPFLEKTKGNIINIGSSMSKRSKPGCIPYTLSKAAIQMFSKHAAYELTAKGVRINSISPGHTKTNILENITVGNPELKERIHNNLIQFLPSGNMLDPKEIALLICLTASDIFPSLNGSDLLLDGAATLA